MSLISRAVAHLFGGVSQQPAAARDPSFVEIGDNVYPAVTEGLLKRFPSEHVDQLDAALTAATYFCHWIVRGPTAAEQFVAVFTGTTIKVFRLDDGTAMTVSTPNGDVYCDESAPRDALRAVSVLDTTIVVNVNKTPAMQADRFGQVVAPQTVSSITRASQVATMTTAIAHTLVTGDWINVSGADQPEYNGWHILTSGSGTTLTYDVTGSPATPATGTITYVARKGSTKGKKQTFANLPTTGLTDGDVWEIEGDDKNSFDGYFVQWNATDSVWVECPQPGAQYIIDPTNMPWALTKTGATTFTFDKITWNNRVVGGTASSPDPSFIGAPVRDVFHHRDRLGFLAGENMVMSRAGDPYHFWRRTVTATLDDDPIDRAVTHAQKLTLRWATPFSTSVLLFSDVAQHVISSGDVLSNSSVRADVATDITCSNKLRPVGIGSDILFAADRSDFSTIHEYFVQRETITNDADDVTKHIPRYVPTNLFAGTACSAEDVAAFVSSSELNKLYVYKRHWEDDKRLQSAWQRFTFDSGDSIVGAKFVGTTLFLAIVRSDGLFLEKMRFESGVLDVVTNYPETGNGFRVMLDRKTTLTGTYDSGNGWTTWTLPYSDNGSFDVILGTAWTGQKGAKLTTTRPSATTIRAVGDYSANPVWVGRNYTKRARLTEVILRDREGLPLVGGRLQLRFMNVMLGSTGYLRAEVTPALRGTWTYPYTGKILGTASATIGRAPVGDATFMFPVLCDSRQATIELINDSYLPSSILGYEWTGFFTSRSAR